MAIALPLTSPEEAARYRKAGLWHDKTFYEFFAGWAARFPNKSALIEYGSQRRVTYAELFRQMENLAGNLLDLGLKPGDVVALQYRNAIEMPLIHFACNRIGVLYMALHDTWRETEVQHLLARSKAKALIIPVEYRDFSHAGMVATIRGNLPDLQHVFTLDGAHPGMREFSELLRPTHLSAAEIDRNRPDPDLPAHTMLSGGTTALSKISRFTSNDLMVMLDNFARCAELSVDDVAAGLAPAGTGATGYNYPIMVPLLYGCTGVILERWSPEDAVEMIIREKCTYGVGIPTQLTRMIPILEKRRPEDFPQFRLFYNSGAPLPYDTGLKIEQMMGCVIQCMYGTTDGGVPVVTKASDPQEKRLGTVGQVVPECDCQLWGPDGKPVPPGEPGEVVWRGADKCWGYLGDDEQTALAFTKDRFYKSGDLGRFDDQGYLRIVGRVKDMILRGGRNISPLTIEQQLIKHPSVIDVSVTSMPDPVLGERACAFVLLREGKSLGFEDMVEFLKAQHLAVWQLPERLEIVEDLPRGPGGKILKSKLTQMVTEKLKAEGKIPA